MWREEVGITEMMLAYIGEFAEFDGWSSWRNVVVDILSCHEEIRRQRIAAAEIDISHELQEESDFKMKNEDDSGVLDSDGMNRTATEKPVILLPKRKDVTSIIPEDKPRFNAEGVIKESGEYIDLVENSNTLYEEAVKLEGLEGEIGVKEEINESSFFDEKFVLNESDQDISNKSQEIGKSEMEGNDLLKMRDLLEISLQQMTYNRISGETFPTPGLPPLSMMPCGSNSFNTSMNVTSGISNALTSELNCAAEKLDNSDRTTCSYCGKRFDKYSAKVRHERIHTGEKPYSCSYCAKSFTQINHKRIHELIHKRERPYVCNFCDKSFCRNEDKQTHERTHTGEKPFSCSFCSKMFSNRRRKRMHERIHTDEKSNECKYCGKRFTHISSLQSHERTHSAQRSNYTCSFCSKTFSSSFGRARHERIHTGEKPFQCQYCPELFSRKDTRSIHERSHMQL